MATNFPASLDTLTNPTSSDSLNSPSHSAQHANVNDAVEALQAKVGADSSAVTTSLDYKVAQLESDVAGFTSGKILQVVSTTKTDTFSASVTAPSFSSNVTGLTATITPSAATSKVMVILHLVGSESVESTDFFIRLMRDTTPICIGDANATRAQASAGICQVGNDSGGVATLMVTYLDSPSTTSAVTYGVQMSHRGASGNVYVNRTSSDINVFQNPRFASTITVMEVSVWSIIPLF
jgi:hypothetical protein